MYPHQGDDDYRRAFEDQLLPAIETFKPQFLLVSAGFDPHRDDPLASIDLSTDMFGWMTQRATEAARQHCQGRLVSVLEGGYELDALADSVEKHVEALIAADNPS
jgi:acetoin utilization deacetylase AcuC-like enzyme